MCNIYQFKSQCTADDTFHAKVAAASISTTPLVRKTNPGVVVRQGGETAVMRWGFHRDFNPAVNNTRADKLAGPMWVEAWRERRCVIPLTAFYEWGPGPCGGKQAHVFNHPDNIWMWVAGLWEDHPSFGLCYSMVTTAAGPAMAPIHSRMPALVGRDEANAWLKGDYLPKAPYSGPLAVLPCPSPLSDNPPPCQPDLF